MCSLLDESLKLLQLYMYHQLCVVVFVFPSVLSFFIFLSFFFHLFFVNWVWPRTLLYFIFLETTLVNTDVQHLDRFVAKVLTEVVRVLHNLGHCHLSSVGSATA